MIQFRTKYKLGNIIAAVGIGFSLVLGIVAIAAGIWLQNNQAPRNADAGINICDGTSYAACINGIPDSTSCVAGYNGICKARSSGSGCDCVATTTNPTPTPAPTPPSNTCNTSTDGKCSNKSIGASCGNGGSCLVVNVTGSLRECECRGESAPPPAPNPTPPNNGAGECDANCTNVTVNDCGPIGVCGAGQRRTGIRRCDGNGDGVQTNCSDVCVNDTQCGGNNNNNSSSGSSSSRRSSTANNSTSSQPSVTPPPTTGLPDTGIISPEADVAIFGVVLVGLGVHLYNVRRKLLLNQ